MTDRTELRVMTYNVRSMRDDLDALAAVVRSREPDVLLVQEAPRFLRWRSKRAALARRCGLVVASADRPGGLCIMTALRVDVLGTSISLLPKAVGHHQRAIVGADLRLGGAHWQVRCLHMSTDAAERARHLPYLRSALTSSADVPLVVGGDLNEEPGGLTFDEMSARMQDCFAAAGAGDGATCPAAAPAQRIDALFASPELTVESCEVVHDARVAAASDHRPVVAVLSQPRDL